MRYFLFVYYRPMSFFSLHSAPAFPTSAALSILPAAVEMFVDALGPKSRSAWILVLLMMILVLLMVILVLLMMIFVLLMMIGMLMCSSCSVLANQQRTAAPIPLKNRVASPTLVPGRLPPQCPDLPQMKTQPQAQPQPQPQEIQHLAVSQGNRLK